MKKVSKEWEPKYRKWCKDLITHLQYKLFLNLYEIDIEWQKKPKGNEGDFKKGEDNCVSGEITTNHRYYSAHITLYPNTLVIWKNGDRRKCAEVIVHEICHIITDPLYKIANNTVSNENLNFIEDTREQLTQHISNIAMGYLEDTKYDFGK